MKFSKFFQFLIWIKASGSGSRRANINRFQPTRFRSRMLLFSIANIDWLIGSVLKADRTRECSFFSPYSANYRTDQADLDPESAKSFGSERIRIRPVWSNSPSWLIPFFLHYIFTVEDFTNIWPNLFGCFFVSIIFEYDCTKLLTNLLRSSSTPLDNVLSYEGFFPAKPKKND